MMNDELYRISFFGNLFFWLGAFSEVVFGEPRHLLHGPHSAGALALPGSDLMSPAIVPSHFRPWKSTGSALFLLFVESRAAASSAFCVCTLMLLTEMLSSFTFHHFKILYKLMIFIKYLSLFNLIYIIYYHLFLFSILYYSLIYSYLVINIYN